MLGSPLATASQAMANVAVSASGWPVKSCLCIQLAVKEVAAMPTQIQQDHLAPETLSEAAVPWCKTAMLVGSVGLCKDRGLCVRLACEEAGAPLLRLRKGETPQRGLRLLFHLCLFCIVTCTSSTDCVSLH